MIQRRGGTGLTPKTLEGQLVVGYIFRQELESDKAAELSVFRLVHHAHPTAAELDQNAVVRNCLPLNGLQIGHVAAILADGGLANAFST
jgi:hypothetical protein